MVSLRKSSQDLGLVQHGAFQKDLEIAYNFILATSVRAQLYRVAKLTSAVSYQRTPRLLAKLSSSTKLTAPA